MSDEEDVSLRLAVVCYLRNVDDFRRGCAGKVDVGRAEVVLRRALFDGQVSEPRSDGWSKAALLRFRDAMNEVPRTPPGRWERFRRWIGI